MIIFIDILTEKDVGSDSYEEVKKCDGAIIGLISKKITLNDDDVDIGGNPSKDGADADEGVDKSEVQTVINIAHSHSLQKVELDKKEAKAAIKSYFKSLITHYNKKKFAILFDDEDYKVPKDKEKAKKAQTEAEKKLSKDQKKSTRKSQEKWNNSKRIFQN